MGELSESHLYFFLTEIVLKLEEAQKNKVRSHRLAFLAGLIATSARSKVYAWLALWPSPCLNAILHRRIRIRFQSNSYMCGI